MSRYLDEIQDVLTRDNIDNHNVTILMVLTRKLLEEMQQTRLTFPCLFLYCDWTVHWEIDRNESCLEFLVSLTDVLIKTYDFRQPYRKVRELENGDLEWIFPQTVVQEVNKSLKIEGLRNEFLNFYYGLGLPLQTFNSSGTWKVFCHALVTNLIDQAIRFPDDISCAGRKIKDLHRSVMMKTTNPEHQVVKFSFVPRGNLPEAITKSWQKSLDVFWQMETVSGPFFVGPFWIPD